MKRKKVMEAQRTWYAARKYCASCGEVTVACVARCWDCYREMHFGILPPSRLITGKHPPANQHHDKPVSQCQYEGDPFNNG